MATRLIQGAIAIITLIGGARPALAQAAAGGVQPTRVMVSSRDSAARTEVIMLRQITPRIDSLLQRLNQLPIGSAEAKAADDSLWIAIRALPQPTAFTASGGGQFRIVATPRTLPFSPLDIIPQGWFGFVAEGITREWDRPNGHIVQHLVYPTVVSIEPNSPASRAGVRSGDSLMAYDGLDLRAQVVNMTQLLTPGREVTVRLRREGESKDVVIAVDKAPPPVLAARKREAAQALVSMERDQRRFEEIRAAATLGAAQAASGRLSPAVPSRTTNPTAVVTSGRSVYTATIGPSVTGVYGAAMANVDEALAESLRGMEGKRGVLVTSVPLASPAYARGLRNGDVILRVQSLEVPTISQLRVRLAAAEQDGAERVKLTILRGGKTQELLFDVR